jgi:hypothetical protein
MNHRRVEAWVCRTFDARVGEDSVHLSFEYQQGGKVVWSTAASWDRVEAA